MLLNKLFTIDTIEVSPSMDRVTVQILLNKDHPLFKGHFPGNPILPGVCTVQIIKELLEESLHKVLILTKANTIKYHGFINPDVTPRIQFDLKFIYTESGRISCNANVNSGAAPLCSFKGEFEFI